MKRILPLLILALLCSCSSKHSSDKADTIVSMQIIDRNGFTETISNKERLSPFQTADFSEPQPYQKVLRVYGRNLDGQSTSKITSYHDNGQLWQYLEVVDGRAHGAYREWLSNGKQKIEAELIEGVADIHELAQSTWVFQGPCKVWDEQGVLLAEFHYEKGALHTPALYYFPSGKLQKSIPYVHGEPDGIFQAFNEEGNLIEEIPYIKGEKEGRAVAYWTQEQLKSEEIYSQDHLLSAAYFDPSGKCVAQVKSGQGSQAQFKENTLHALLTITNGVPEGQMQFFQPSGALHCTYTLQEGKKNGEEVEYYSAEKHETLRPKLSVHWSDDKIQGQVKTWYKEGQMQSQREINNNKKQGISFAWYKNSDLMMVEEYENDLLVKGSYYKKGDKKAVTKVESGKGVASFYTSDGIFTKKVNYEKGKPLLTTDSIH